MEGYTTAREAAERLGYEYSWFTRKLSAGEVPNAFRWQRTWVVPEDVTREQVEKPLGRPKRS